MTDNNYTEIAAVIDRSSSMARTAPEVIDGFNMFVASQKKLPGKALLTTVTFDTSYTTLHRGQDIRSLPEKTLNEDNYRPQGMTALLDATGRTITELGARLAALPDDQRPGRVIVLIMTDGEENSSREFSGGQIAEMIKHQREKYSWEFVFLGANIDSFAVGAHLNIAASNIANYSQTKGGTRQAMHRLERAVSQYRLTGDVGNVSAPDPLDQLTSDSDAN